LFRLVTAEDTVRIPPERFGEDIEKVCCDQLKMKYEGMVDPEIGFVIIVTDVKVNPVGRIIPGDGGTYHRVTFTLLTFKPEIQEVVEGEVVEIADFGAFVRIGPVEALLHVSQLMDDFITYDEKQGILAGKETGRRLAIGDRVRVRITAISIGRGGMASKIGVTARQPFLGKLEWIEEEIKKSKGEEKTEES